MHRACHCGLAQYTLNASARQRVLMQLESGQGTAVAVLFSTARHYPKGKKPSSISGLSRTSSALPSLNLSGSNSSAAANRLTVQ